MAKSISSRSCISNFGVPLLFHYDTPQTLNYISEEIYSIEDMHTYPIYKSLSSRSKKVNRALPLKIRSKFNNDGVMKNGRDSKRSI